MQFFEVGMVGGGEEGRRGVYDLGEGVFVVEVVAELEVI
jgi:hypothetical protein